MAQRGRTSADAASVEVIAGGFGQRPEPPADLNTEEASIWRETVSGEPVDFFSTPALRALLTDYCRHRASADAISEVIGVFKPDWLKSSEGAKRYHGLLKMRDLETRAAADKATKLRLTNQSRYTPLSAATASRNAAKGVKPWEL
ncbi:hypothetical protein [Rubellimicrobium arenae]|uniref:hypothetical protein n=1 Tax=Rubellimicrobium arenae TaxID=2817372 RepID=UPI001B317788|nr:hypothetical protein [Rubellimicrobium arenae]